MRANRNEEFQLVVREVKSFREVGQYNLTPWNVYVVGVTVFLLLLILVFLLIALTPLRSYIPGYGNTAQRSEINELESTVEELAGRLEGQSVYIEALRKTVTGEATTADDIPPIAELVDTTTLRPVPLSDDELALRQEMALQRIGNTSGRERAVVRPAPGSDDVPLAQIYLVAPVNGEISAPFNPADNHHGVDILAPQNTAIKAVRDGVVFMSEFTSANGNVIGIQHDNNLVSFYKHNSQLLKDVGQRVRAGEAVAIIGNTGELTSGPHLHFELWYEGEVVDPVGVLRF